MTSEFDLSQAVEDSDESTVDLTHEWEDDSTVDLTQDEIHVRGLEETIDLLNLKDEDEDEGIELLFVTEIECVGLQYYNGVAHAGEDIYLIREPYNRHDRNAIRVDNCHHEIVGHIRSTVAKYLSLILDDMNLRSSVEYGIEKMDASIPRSAGIYTMPIELEMYGRYSDKVNKIHILLQRSGVVIKQARYSYKPMTQQIESRMASILKQEEVRPIPRITFPFPLDEEVRPRPRMAATLPLDEVPMVTTTDWKSQSELDDIFDKNQQSLSTLPCIQPPEQLITNLLKHQLVGLSWMYQRENTDQINPLFVKVTEKGKTVWLSTITHSSQPREPTAVRGGLLCDEMGLGKTLMTIALILKNPPQGLTYPPGRDIQDDRLGGSSSQNRPRGGVLKTIPRNSITTLIVCPLSVMSNWMDQIDQHVKPGVLKVRTYQGPNRGKLVDEIINNKIDILLASYHTLAIDFKSNFGDEDAPTQKKQKVDSIFSVRFHRVVLDECHMIRNNKTSMFKACVKIDAQFKFGLTGTPIQNKPEDVYSLFRFLNVEPVCCEKNFRSSIAQPIRNGDPKGLTLLRTILCHVALRRTKEKEGIRLPEKTVEVCSIKFREDSIDYKIYSILFKSARVAFAAILTGGEEYVLNQYMSILETILRLRQTWFVWYICTHQL
jgi:SWI/SNF-related matrix-associated actin-dependent regulator of chromatin subfamily A3